MEKIKIRENTVQETLVIPLYGRKLCTERHPNLFRDDRAATLMERLDYDFSKLEAKQSKFFQRFGALEVGMRQTAMMTEVRQYLKKHPAAAVVNMGCGLDYTGEVCDNGQCRIYNMDRPDVIALRNRLLPPGERTENIAADLKDTAWFDAVDASEGVIFFAAGVFYYFIREEAHELFRAMVKQFPGGVLVFDTAGKMATKMAVKTWLREIGSTVKKLFYVNRMDRDLAPFLPDVRLSTKGYMTGYNDLTDPSISRPLRWMSRFSDGPLSLQIIKMVF
ncbi:MAG: class I SAM-dependent methyltransferase [Eubacteriales bacterium]|nr:class I SAM-dependent methyltransferase [Eubacteriales bacterium]